MPGATLAPVAGTRAATSSTKENGGDQPRVEGPAAAAPARRVDEHAVDARQVGVRDVLAAHLDPVAGAEDGGVRPATATVSGSRSTATAPARAARRADQVAADAAAQVGDPLDGCPGEARGVTRGDARAGRLLEPVGREAQPGGLLAELGPGPGAQPGLGQGGRRQVGVDAVPPQRCRARQGLLPVVRGDPGEQRGPSAVSRARNAATSREGPRGRSCQPGVKVRLAGADGSLIPDAGELQMDADKARHGAL